MLQPTARSMNLTLLAALVGGLARLAAARGTNTNASSNATKDSKMAAVKKVVVMLNELQTQVLEAGEQEAATYNEFSCFCKDTMDEKSTAITEGEGSQSTLTASLNTLATRRDELDSDISGFETEITNTEQEMDVLETKRRKELSEYERDEADVSGAVSALQGAIKALKAAKTPTFAQLQAVAQTVRLATVMADALGFAGASEAKGAASFFLQEAPEVSIEAYSFKADGIIQTLESLLGDFKTQKNTLDQAEVSAVAAHDQLMQTKSNHVTAKNVELTTAKKQKAEKQEEIATSSQDLSVVSAELLDDKAYLTELATMCSNKARTWDKRSQVRSDELSAITAALAIIEGTVSEKTSASTIRFAQRGVTVRFAEVVARDASDVEAPEVRGPVQGAITAVPAFVKGKKVSREAAMGLPTARKAVGFFAQRSVIATGQEAEPAAAEALQAVANLLRNEGQHLKSSMLVGLASQIAGDPFAKVKTLISELIERLLMQAEKEATQKGWCDKSIVEAELKRDHSAEEIRGLNGEMAVSEARRDKLVEEVKKLVEEMAALEKEQEEARVARVAEEAENAQTISEAKAGQEAVAGAIDLLDKFYKTAAQGNFFQIQRGPAAEDAPDSGFAANETYNGAWSQASGVIGLLEVIEGDFTRTVVETTQAERQAKQDYLGFTTRTGVSLAEKKTAETQKTTQRDSVGEKLSDDDDNLNAQVQLLKGAIAELLDLKTACGYDMANDLDKMAARWDDRTADREAEIEALKKAECMLTSYAQYGPDSAVSADC